MIGSYLFEVRIDRPVQILRDFLLIGVLWKWIDEVGDTQRCKFTVPYGCVGAVIAHLNLIFLMIKFRPILNQDEMKSKMSQPVRLPDKLGDLKKLFRVERNLYKTCQKERKWG